MSPRNPRSLRELWSDNPWPGKVTAAAIIVVLVVMLVGAYGFTRLYFTIDAEQSRNDMQAKDIAAATLATGEARYQVDLAVCRRVAEVHGRVLLNAVALRRLLDVVLLVPRDPNATSQQRIARDAFERVQDQLRKSQAELKRERDRNCVKTVRRPNGEESKLEDVISGREPVVPPSVPGSTQMVTTTIPGPTVPGPTSTRTVTQRETVTPPTRTVTRKTTVTLPPRTETAAVEVPGPTQTVTQQVPVVVPPQTVTVTVAVPPAAPTTTDQEVP